MLFNSFGFLIFFPIVIIFYYLVPATNFRKVLLILASIFFVFQANLISLLVILCSVVFNYFLGLEIFKRADKKSGTAIFIFGISINIAALILFKYLTFLTTNLDYILKPFNLNLENLNVGWILPLGISFYTFQAMSYLIEVYRGTMEAEKHFINFSNYLLYFPKLLAGPVERPYNFLPQFQNKIRFDWNNINAGLQRVIWGFFKKLVIADRLAIYANTVFANHEHHNGTTLLFATILYVFQLYADFSGYTDIALGLAKMMGINLMENFRFPLYATSVTEFWRRWHISLSSWANDYIFKPFSMKYRNWGIYSLIVGLFVTFLIIGLWHGPTWGFIMFGIAQGIAIIFELFSLQIRIKIFKFVPQQIILFISILVTLLFFTLSCVFFNFNSITESFNVYHKIFTDSGKLNILTQSQFVYSMFGVLFLLIVEIFFINKKKNAFPFISSPWLIGIFWNVTLVILIIMLGVFDGGQFIYFGF